MRLRYKILIYAVIITGLIYWIARQTYVIIDTGYTLAYQADSGVDTHLAHMLAMDCEGEMIRGTAIIIILTIALLWLIGKKCKTKN